MNSYDVSGSNSYHNRVLCVERGAASEWKYPSLVEDLYTAVSG